jgi:hypothetical protein
MVGTCGMQTGDEKYIQNLVKNLKEEDHLGDLYIHGRIILKWI